MNALCEAYRSDNILVSLYKKYCVETSSHAPYNIGDGSIDGTDLGLHAPYNESSSICFGIYSDDSILINRNNGDRIYIKAYIYIIFQFFIY